MEQRGTPTILTRHQSGLCTRSGCAIPHGCGTLSGYTVAKSEIGPVPAGIVIRHDNLLTYGHQPLDNFSPRVGFAWQPLGNSGKFVVRGGYGLFYNTIMGNTFEIEINNNPPSTAPFTYIGTQNALSNLSNPTILFRVWASAAFCARRRPRSVRTVWIPISLRLTWKATTSTRSTR